MHEKYATVKNDMPRLAIYYFILPTEQCLYVSLFPLGLDLSPNPFVPLQSVPPYPSNWYSVTSLLCQRLMIAIICFSRKESVDDSSAQSSLWYFLLLLITAAVS
jgi:hypothetical protein